MLATILTAMAVAVATAFVGIIGKAVNGWSAREKQKADRVKTANTKYDAVEALRTGITTIGETVVKGLKDAAKDGKLSKTEMKTVQRNAIDEAIKIATNPDAIGFLVNTTFEALSAIITGIVQGKKTK